MREKFLQLVNENIKREGINELLEWLDKSDFYISPASTKYHACHKGGLLEHSINVYECLINVLKSNNITEYSDESIAIVSLMHDLCKCNFYFEEWKNVKVYKDSGTKRDAGGKFDWETQLGYSIKDQFPVGHGEKSVIILQQFIKLTTDEIYAIRWHMSGFDNAVKGGDYGLMQAYEKSKLAVALCLADLSATYFIEVDKKGE